MKTLDTILLITILAMTIIGVLPVLPVQANTAPQHQTVAMEEAPEQTNHQQNTAESGISGSIALWVIIGMVVLLFGVLSLAPLLAEPLQLP